MTMFVQMCRLAKPHGGLVRCILKRSSCTPELQYLRPLLKQLADVHKPSADAIRASGAGKVNTGPML